MKVLLVAGAGTSIELGVPGMAGLAEEFLEHARQWDIEEDIVRRIFGSSLDIEHLIEEIDKICSARESFELLDQKGGDFQRFDKIRAEVEWFIQHAAERIVPRDAHLMWGGVLRSSRDINLTIVTTNYDRAIELAANTMGISINDGFGSFGFSETAVWEGFEHTMEGVPLVKLHGSTDWYTDRGTGKPTKLRHPMPLFGRSVLQLPSGAELGSALILPSREKLLTRDPYPRLSQAFLNATDNCELVIVIGSSLRDHHIRGAVESMVSRIPTFIVNPEGNIQGISGAIGVSQAASAFLIGTLPACLLAEDTSGALLNASKRPEVGVDTLRSLRTALDSELSSHSRCRALEELDSWGAALDSAWIEELLRSPDPHVARYSLGLIAVAPHRNELSAIAAQSPHASSDKAYQEDLRLLEEYHKQDVT